MATSTSSNIKAPKSHRCSRCGRVFESMEALSAHERMEHDKSSHPPAGVG